MHQFIENYFKDSIDSIKSLHAKIKDRDVKNNRNSLHVISDINTIPFFAEDILFFFLHSYFDI